MVGIGKITATSGMRGYRSIGRGDAFIRRSELLRYCILLHIGLKFYYKGWEEISGQTLKVDNRRYPAKILLLHLGLGVLVRLLKQAC